MYTDPGIGIANPFRSGIAGLMKGPIHISDDLDEPLDDFKEYMAG